MLYFPTKAIGAVNVYTWGSNSNVTLGHDHSRKYPEKLEFPQNYIISQVFNMCLMIINQETDIMCAVIALPAVFNVFYTSLIVPCDRSTSLSQLYAICMSLF